MSVKILISKIDDPQEIIFEMSAKGNTNPCNTPLKKP